MDKSSIVAIIVCLVSALAGFASQRAASKASVRTTTIEGRVDMEREAYMRARKLDTETIERQAQEIVELRKREDDLERKVEELEVEVEDLRQQLGRKNNDHNSRTTNGPTTQLSDSGSGHGVDLTDPDNHGL